MSLMPEIKKLWVEALRSGNYAQGKHALCVVNEDDPSKKSYCCLGVLMDIIKDRPEFEDFKMRWDTKAKREATDNADGVIFINELIYQYRSPFGEFIETSARGDIPISIKNELPELMHQTSVLIDMNDYTNKDFDKIADYIEEKFGD